MSWTFFIFVWCSCIQPVLMQTTSWDLVTSPAVFGKPVELRCTVVGASCCSQLTRIWNRGLIDILNNGKTNFPSKYRETLDAPNKHFSLIINNLTKDDVDVVYTCAYGNISPQKTLTQNDSFEYHPTESCPVKIDNGELVGTLSVPMSAPYPSVFAQYGDSNFTSYLTTNITPVAGSTKFYTINSSLKRKATCGNYEKFTLSVLTGITTTNICDKVDFCTGECLKCIGWCYLWSILGITLTLFGLIIVFRLFPDVQIQKKIYTVGTGNNVTMECTVTSFFPVTKVFWKRNIDNLIVITETNEKRCCTPRPAYFVLKSATQDQASTYTCFVKNRVGTGQSSAITLSVTEIEDLRQNLAEETEPVENASNTVEDLRQNLAEETEPVENASNTVEDLRQNLAEETEPVENASNTVKDLHQNLAEQTETVENASNTGPVFLTKKRRMGAVVSAVGNDLLGILIRHELFFTKKHGIKAVAVIATVNAVLVILIGLYICPCIYGLEPVTIELGVLTCCIPAAFILYEISDDKCHWFILLVLLIISTHLLLFLPYLLFKLCLLVQYKLNLCCKKTDDHHDQHHADLIELQSY